MVSISLRFKKVLRLFKLTHFHISVKEKGSLRGYFGFEIGELRLNIDLRMIPRHLCLIVSFLGRGRGDPIDGKWGFSSFEPAGWRERSKRGFFQPSQQDHKVGLGLFELLPNRQAELFRRGRQSHRSQGLVFEASPVKHLVHVGVLRREPALSVPPSLDIF